MKTFRFLFGIITLLLCAAPRFAGAQQDPMVSQYMFSGHFINPAYAGSHPYANITLLGRKQWVGFRGSPFTSFLSFDKPFLQKHIGIGALVSRDQVGVSNRTQVSATFAYHLHINANARLAAGLSAGAQFYSAELSKLTVWDEDEVFNSNINGKALPVAGVGLYFYTQRLYAGLSIPNIISYKPGTFLNNFFAEDLPRFERHYYATAGYAIPAGKNIDVKPSILVKYVSGAPAQADYSLHVLFNKVLWVGATYRTKDAVVGMVEYRVTKNLRVGYAYDMSVTRLQQYNSGSHEIMLAWDFAKDSDDVYFKSPRFF
jgi:type IX secretion system PorP/SprF family membrane protein